MPGSSMYGWPDCVVPSPGALETLPMALPGRLPDTLELAALSRPLYALVAPTAPGVVVGVA
jgi:hypothetical protein